MRRILMGALAVSLVLGAQALAGGPCCDKARADNAWCNTCSQGFMFNVAIAKKALYTALAGMAPNDKCEGCKAVATSGGICEKCHVGIAGGKAYKAMPVYYIVKGTKGDAAAMTCPTCQSVCMSNLTGWCDKCKAGLVVCYTFKDKPEYEKANSGLTTIQTAAKNPCETCGVAIVTDGTCNACKVTYKDGKPTKT